jgi:hypothetical protein
MLCMRHASRLIKGHEDALRDSWNREIAEAAENKIRVITAISPCESMFSAKVSNAFSGTEQIVLRIQLLLLRFPRLHRCFLGRLSYNVFLLDLLRLLATKHFSPFLSFLWLDRAE